VSVQFGRCNFDGRPADREYFARAEGMLAPYGPDARGTYIKESVGILFRAFHTTKESRSEGQPHITHSGTALTWDGRLDNRAELIRQLRNVPTIGSNDVAIVAAAYEEWGKDCFGKLIGDWALSIWDANTRSLILAKDFIGTRHLYYLVEKNQVTWSTLLDPLVLLAGKTFALCEEYIAGWLSYFPATHLTPYVGIQSVPPSSSVFLRPGKHTVQRYWDFDPDNRIRYRTDAEYEEHFRTVFAEAVQRRLRSDKPVLAELSGGMDSSSIVCMADTVIARGAAETPRLDTLSYYNDSEPNWNERPYFTKVEEKRGRTGCHIDVSSQASLIFEYEQGRFPATPGSGAQPSDIVKKLFDCLATGGNNVLLSGIGGDEVLGGVPTPIPELADLLTAGKFHRLAHQLVAWALAKRKPVLYLLSETIKAFFPIRVVGVRKSNRSAPWLCADFLRRQRWILQGYENRLKVFGPLPSFQDNLNTLDALRRQLACPTPPSRPTYEKRYPFLDRDLLEFLYSIPREQLVRPNHRRSLMRRSLSGIVPDEVLQRKRKAFVDRALVVSVASEWPRLLKHAQHLLLTRMGLVDPGGLATALQSVRRGDDFPLVLLMRTFGIENWMRTLVRWNVLSTGLDQRDETAVRGFAYKECEWSGK
jgi:asparagine synthase (glutamine-hydrolysing)